MANLAYNEGLIFWNNWEDSATPAYTIKAALVGTSYSPDKDDSSLTAIAGFEAVDSDGATPSYDREELTGRTEVIDTGSDYVIYDATDTLWSGLDTDDPVSAAVIYIEEETATPTDAGATLLAYMDFDTVQPNGTNFTIIWPSTGVARLRQAP